MKYLWSLAVASSVILTFSFVSGQFFDPKVNDKVYLDTIHKEVEGQVGESQSELIQESLKIQQLTKNYIGAQLKQNLFKALRVLVEKELRQIKKADSLNPRQGPPSPPEESGNEGEEEEEKTTRRPSVILPQLANLVKAVFGGNVNLTAYVESASQFLPKPISNQIVGVVKLLANNPGYTTTTVPPSTTLETTLSSAKPVKKASPKTTQTTSTKFEEYEEEEIKDVSASVSSSSPPPPVVVAGDVAGSTKSSRPRKSTTGGGKPTEGSTTTVETTPTEPSAGEETTTEEDEDEDEFNNPIYTKQNSPVNPQSNQKTQRQIPGLNILGGIGSALGNLFGGQNKDKDKEKVKDGDATTITSTTTGEADDEVTETESTTVKTTTTVRTRNRSKATSTTVASGFEEGEKMEMAQKMQGFDIGKLIKEVQTGVEDILKVIPDIFGGGAREAYKLLGSVTKLFSRLDEE